MPEITDHLKTGDFSRVKKDTGHEKVENQEPQLQTHESNEVDLDRALRHKQNEMSPSSIQFPEPNPVKKGVETQENEKVENTEPQLQTHEPNDDGLKPSLREKQNERSPSSIQFPEPNPVKKGVETQENEKVENTEPKLQTHEPNEVDLDRALRQKQNERPPSSVQFPEVSPRKSVGEILGKDRPKKIDPPANPLQQEVDGLQGTSPKLGGVPVGSEPQPGIQEGTRQTVGMTLNRPKLQATTAAQNTSKLKFGP